MSAGWPCAASIGACFDALFLPTHHTILRGGADEPFYEPARDGLPAQIFYRYDYPSSALHEVAHWCIAGRERRKLPDYGYWYHPDGRSAQQQRLFMAVEARPQALEQLFSTACGLPFRPSLDNLDAPYDEVLAKAFVEHIEAARQRLLLEGLPPRAARFHAALQDMNRSTAGGWTSAA